MLTTEDPWRDLFAPIERRAERMRHLMDQLLVNHGLFCRDGACPFNTPQREIVITDRFIPDSAGVGGWGHRNLTSHIGWIGEFLGHLAVPEICLHGGTGVLNTAMDGTSPRGDAEFKTATPCQHGASGTRVTFTVRASQRRDHSLPCVCIAMDAAFLHEFRGRRIVLPNDAVEIALHIDDVFLIPLAGFPVPQSCFIIPGLPSAERPIRALQTVFRTDYRGLRDLGLEGLCRLRAIFDAPEKVDAALSYIEVLGKELSEAELRAYQLDPHRLLADSEALVRGVPLNGRVEEAIALRTLARRRVERERERAEAERELFAHWREQQERADRSLRQQLAWAFLGLITLAAGYPVSAVDMRWKYGLRRDTYFPPAFNREAADQGIAVLIEGERRRVRAGGSVRERRLTQAERQAMERRLPEWKVVIHHAAEHVFTRAILERWREEAKTNPVAERALALVPTTPDTDRPDQLRLFHAEGADERELIKV